LSEPWTWRQGRYEQFLRHCYAHVVTCLLKQEQQMGKAPLAHYFRALREWYGCLTTDDPVRSLSTILQACKAFRENCERRSDLQMELETADRLADVCESLVFFDHETEISHQEEQVLQPFEVTNYLREVVDSRIPIRAPSKPFKPRLRDYCVAHAEWRKMYETISVSRPSLEKFNRLLATYKNQERVAYAAAHELAVLQNAHHRDVERINRFTHAVETGPIIKITLRNPWVTLGVREKLALEVENVGGAVANQFKLELNPTKEFELFTAVVPLALEVFELGKRHRLEYEIRVKETALALNLSYSYRDHRNQQQHHREIINLEIREPHATNVKPRGNLYEVGRPVSTRDRFFGRRAELEQILTRLVGGSTQPILLRGPRRMGKTSLLHQLELVLRDHQELRRLGLSHELETQLSAVHPVFASLQSLSLSMNGSGQNYYVARFLQTIIEDICHVLHIEWSTEQIHKSFDQLSPSRAFIKQINGIFSQRPGKRLLVLIDEWDEIFREEYSELGTNLRYLLQQEQRISWVFSSTWALHKEIGQHGSPFYNQCFTIELKEMDWESAVRLVIELSNEVGVDWHGDAVVALLELTGQRPYLTQLLCSRIMDCLIEKSTNVVDTNLVAFVASQMITQAQATAHYFGSLWNDESVRKGDKNGVRWMGRLILWALEASGSKSLARSEIREEIANEFKQFALALPNQDFVNQEFDDQMTKLQWIFDAITLADKRYTFGIPLIQRWLHQVISHEEDFIKQAHAGLMQDVQRQ